MYLSLAAFDKLQKIRSGFLYLYQVLNRRAVIGSLQRVTRRIFEICNYFHFIEVFLNFETIMEYTESNYSMLQSFKIYYSSPSPIPLTFHAGLGNGRKNKHKSCTLSPLKLVKVHVRRQKYNFLAQSACSVWYYSEQCEAF